LYGAFSVKGLFPRGWADPLIVLWALLTVLCSERKFAALMDLPEKPDHSVPMVEQLPTRYVPVFTKGCIDKTLLGAPVRMLGAIVDAGQRAEELVLTLEAGLTEARIRAERLPQRPKVFFEEWDDPLISGIGWVSELVEIAGGIDIFADRRQGAAKDRVVTAEEVVAREPDLIIGSWCGKKFRPERVATRPGFAQTAAVQRQDMYEIKSSCSPAQPL
jgi:ABC-type Fe3+-hydroxamate transport system substrate-binding protein